MTEPQIKLSIYGDQGYVHLYDFSKANTSMSNRIEVVTKVALSSFGKEEAKSPQNLYEHLLKELKTPLEFIRIGPKYDIESSLRNHPDAPLETNVNKYSENVTCIHFKAPLLVIAHIVRHRSFSYNQCSRRYTKVNKNDIFIPSELQRNNAFLKSIDDSIALYEKLIVEGAKKEIARGVLPGYLIMSDMWMIGDKKAWHSLFKTRLSTSENVMNLTKELVQGMYDAIHLYQPNILKGLDLTHV